MPRYYLDIRNGEYVADVVGVEFADLEAARIEAVERSADWLRKDPAKFWAVEEWQLEVRDEARLILFILTATATNAPHLPRRDTSWPSPDRRAP